MGFVPYPGPKSLYSQDPKSRWCVDVDYLPLLSLKLIFSELSLRYAIIIPFTKKCTTYRMERALRGGPLAVIQLKFSYPGLTSLFHHSWWTHQGGLTGFVEFFSSLIFSGNIELKSPMFSEPYAIHLSSSPDLAMTIPLFI